MAQDSTPTWQELLDLVAQLDQGAYDSVAVTFGSVSVRMSRDGAALEAAPAAPTPVSGPAPVAASAAPAAAPVAATGTAITAPMLGVFYRRPSPGADPFVQPGQAVQPDTTIGIIEIMKLMNPVVAGVTGTLTAFEVEDGTSVQFGETLARVDPGTP